MHLEVDWKRQGEEKAAYFHVANLEAAERLMNAILDDANNITTIVIWDNNGQRAGGWPTRK
jgi:hypothetical protein